MAFDVSGISTWNNELADRASLLMTPILGARTMGLVKNIGGITGENQKLPVFETTTPWQATAGCSYTTSGTTTVTQKTITTTRIQIQETICPNDLLNLFTKQAWVPGQATPETGEVLSWWIQRKMAKVKNQIENALWQSKTTYTNATHLKAFNGFIAQIDTAADAVAATQQASISTSTVRGIFEDIIYTKLPTNLPQIMDMDPVVYVSYEDFMILQLKLMQDNLYHFVPTSAEFKSYEMTYPGTNVRVIGVPGLNSGNGVDTGALPTAVKHRIFCTYKDNLIGAYNTTNEMADFDVWYSKDDRNIKCHMAFYIGVLPVFTNHIIQYTNS